MSHRAVLGAVVGAVVVTAAVIGGARLNAPLAPEAVHAQGNLKYTGAASCGASNCHGNTKPKADYPRMNENMPWLLFSFICLASLLSLIALLPTKSTARILTFGPSVMWNVTLTSFGPPSTGLISGLTSTNSYPFSA